MHQQLEQIKKQADKLTEYQLSLHATKAEVTRLNALIEKTRLKEYVNLKTVATPESTRAPICEHRPWNETNSFFVSVSTAEEKAPEDGQVQQQGGRGSIGSGGAHVMFENAETAAVASPHMTGPAAAAGVAAASASAATPTAAAATTAAGAASATTDPLAAFVVHQDEGGDDDEDGTCHLPGSLNAVCSPLHNVCMRQQRDRGDPHRPC